MPRSLILLSIVVFTACNRLPESYPPPPQRAPLTSTTSELSYFVSLSDSNADTYLVRDFAPAAGAGPTRWAFDHPVLRFFVPAQPRLQFTMDFALPERAYRDTGPVTLTFRINGELLDRHRFDAAGEQHYVHEVPAAMLRANAVNLVAIDPEPVWISKSDGTHIGFVLARAGFTD